MIVPKINDWVACRGFIFSPGKVFEIDEAGQRFKAYFINEPDFDTCVVASDWLLFSIIERVIVDPAEIAELNAELSS